MREQTAFDIFLPQVQPPTPRPHRNASVKARDETPFLIDAPTRADPAAEQSLWTKRAVLVASWRRNYGWDLLDCAFELQVTLKALLAGFQRHNIQIPDTHEELTTDRPCSSCGRLVRATRFQRLCKSTAKAGDDCGGSAELVRDIERRERKRKHGAEGERP